MEYSDDVSDLSPVSGVDASPTESGFHHIHFGHLGLIVACALLLFGVAFAKGAINLNMFSKQASSEQQESRLTYEGLKQKFDSENTLSLNTSAGTQSDLLAALDPNISAEAILGTTTGALAFPQAEELFTPRVLEAIQIKNTIETSLESVQDYANEIVQIERGGSHLKLLVSLSSEDEEELLQAKNSAEEFIRYMGQMQVPSQLVEYHKLKIIWYNTLANMAENFAYPDSENSENNLALFFSLTQKLERLSSELFSKYGISL